MDPKYQLFITGTHFTFKVAEEWILDVLQGTLQGSQIL